MRVMGVAWVLLISEFAIAAVHAQSVPVKLDSTATDKKAIQALLDNYTKAVSNKDQKLFESLLLNTNIPFSYVIAAVRNADKPNGTSNYEDFRKGVFAGPQFTQRFQDVHIQQDGALADVSLVFVNTDAHGTSWGWKTLQLIEVQGQWKIASEFFTSH